MRTGKGLRFEQNNGLSVNKEMNKKILIISVCAIIALVLAIVVFWYYHPTCYKYNDQFIIGNTAEKISEKYGEFTVIFRDNKGEMSCGIYKVRDNTPELIMSYDNSLWYEIYFENGIAVSVRLQEGWYGG